MLALVGSARGLGTSLAHAQYFGQNKIQYELYQLALDPLRPLRGLLLRRLGQPGDAHARPGREDRTRCSPSALGHHLSRRIPIILYASHNDFSADQRHPRADRRLDGRLHGGAARPRRGAVLGLVRGLPARARARARARVPVRHPLQRHRHVAALGPGLLPGAAVVRRGHGRVLLARHGAERRDVVPRRHAHRLHAAAASTRAATRSTRSGSRAIELPDRPLRRGAVPRRAQARPPDAQLRPRVRAHLRHVRRRSSTSSGAIYLRKRYWPTRRQRTSRPETYGRRLTDHRRDESNINISPSVSPQGDRVAYYSDRRQYTDIYVMSAFDGRVLRRVIRGERNVQFESMPLFRSVARVVAGRQPARAHRQEPRPRPAVRRRRHARAHVVQRLRAAVRRAAVPGVVAGRATRSWSRGCQGRPLRSLPRPRRAPAPSTRLTDDAWDEKEPTWSPGRPARHVLLRPARRRSCCSRSRRRAATATTDCYDLDLATRATSLRCSTRRARTTSRRGRPTAAGWRSSPTATARRTSTSTTRRDQHDHAADRRARRRDQPVVVAPERPARVLGVRPRRLGHVRGAGAAAPNDGVLMRLRATHPARCSAWRRRRSPPRRGLRASRAPRGALARRVAGQRHGARHVAHGAAAARPERERMARSPPVATEPPAWNGGRRTHEPMQATCRCCPRCRRHRRGRCPSARRSSSTAARSRFPTACSGRSRRPYHWHLGAEQANGGFAAATGFGFVGSTSLLFSDFLGDRNLYIATDVLPGLARGDQRAGDLQLPAAPAGTGAWARSTSRTTSSRGVTTLGEQLTQRPGVLGADVRRTGRSCRTRSTASAAPTSQFTQMFVQRTFYVRDVFGDYVRGTATYRSVTSPSVSLVGDNSLSGYYGPVNGSRYNLTFAPARGRCSRTRSRTRRSRSTTGKYWDLTSGYTFAFRTLDAGSWGRDPQAFRVGGFSTLRGYPGLRPGRFAAGAR